MRRNITHTTSSKSSYLLFQTASIYTRKNITCPFLSSYYIPIMENRWDERSHL